jgi:hypothetical protein
MAVGLGGDPTQVLPSPTGGDTPPPPHERGEARIAFTGKVEGDAVRRVLRRLVP